MESLDRPFPPHIERQASELAEQYQIIMEWIDSEWYGYPLELPNAKSAGPTPTVCMANVKDSISALSGYMLKMGQTPPPPVAKVRRLPPVHPGDILSEDFIKPLGLSRRQIAKDTGIPLRHINAIINGKRPILADAAMRLGRYFGTSARFWLNSQMRYELEITEDEQADKIENEVKPLERKTS